MSDYVEQTSEALEDIRSIAVCIAGIARAFRETGNTIMADRLHDLACDLSNAEKMIISAIISSSTVVKEDES